MTAEEQTAAQEWEAYQRALKNSQFRDVSWLLRAEEDEAHWEWLWKQEKGDQD